MQENKTGIGEGILRGLKKIIFNSGETELSRPAPAVETKTNVTTGSNSTDQGKQMTPQNVQPAGTDMKLRVYQLLEKMNKPGCDFFEVWNASAEMGGVNAGNIKAAYTSLRFADPSLNKIKLEETGNFYMSELRKILDSETTKRLEEKTRLEKEKEQQKANLSAEVNKLEQEIAVLKEKLEKRKSEKQNIDQTYEPQLQSIEEKIREGGLSVNAVLDEMQQVKQMIQQGIN